jgi:hypothetical protein
MAVADRVFPASTAPADHECPHHSSARLPKAFITACDNWDPSLMIVRCFARERDAAGAGGRHPGRKAEQLGAPLLCWRDLFIVLHGGGRTSDWKRKKWCSWTEIFVMEFSRDTRECATVLDDTRLDTFSARPLVCISGPSVISTQLPPIAEEAGHEERSESCVARPTPETGPVAAGDFATTFAKFQRQGKWVLQSRTVVEDVLYQPAQEPQHPDVLLNIHNWIVNIDCPRIKALFDPADWDEICAAVKPLPEAPEAVVRELAERLLAVRTVAASSSD